MGYQEELDKLVQEVNSSSGPISTGFDEGPIKQGTSFDSLSSISPAKVSNTEPGKPPLLPGNPNSTKAFRPTKEQIDKSEIGSYVNSGLYDDNTPIFGSVTPGLPTPLGALNTPGGGGNLGVKINVDNKKYNYIKWAADSSTDKEGGWFRNSKIVPEFIKNFPVSMAKLPGRIMIGMLKDYPETIAKEFVENAKSNLDPEGKLRNSSNKDRIIGNIESSKRQTHNVVKPLEDVFYAGIKGAGVYDTVRDVSSGKVIFTEKVEDNDFVKDRVVFAMPEFKEFKEQWNNDPAGTMFVYFPFLVHGLAKSAAKKATSAKEAAELNAMAEDALERARAVREEGANIHKVSNENLRKQSAILEEEGFFGDPSMSEFGEGITKSFDEVGMSDAMKGLGDETSKGEVKTKTRRPTTKEKKAAEAKAKAEEEQKRSDQKLDGEEIGIPVTEEVLIDNIKNNSLDSTTGIKSKEGRVRPLKNPEEHEFFQSAEDTNIKSEIYRDYGEEVKTDPELYLFSLINEVNRWYHKHEGADVVKARQKLSELAQRVDELKEDFVDPIKVENARGELVGKDPTYDYNERFEDFKATAQKAAQWARRLKKQNEMSETAERSLNPKKKHERSPEDTTPEEAYGTVADIEFLMGVPVERVWDMLKNKTRVIKDSMIRSVNSNEVNLIRDIAKLHTKNKFDVDITYSKGEIWRKAGIEPKHKFDKFPQTKDTIEADASKKIPLQDSSVESVFFDPPFIVKTHKSSNKGMMVDRFNGFDSVEDLWTMIKGSVAESARILKPGGVLVVKIQDVTTGTTPHNAKGTYFTSAEVYNFATQAGLRPLDRFIYENKNPMPLPPNTVSQSIAKKVHNDFLVFRKPGSTSTYEYPKSGGVKLYSGVDPVEGYKKLRAYFDKVDKAKALNTGERKTTVNDVIRSAKRRFLSQSANLKEALMMVHGQKGGYEVLQKMNLSISATSKSSAMADQFKREILGDLNEAQRKALNEVAFARRTRQIIDRDTAKKAADKKYRVHKNPDDMTREDCQNFIDNIHLDGLSKAEVAEVYRRVDMLFDIYRDQLTQLRDNGLITQKVFNDLEHLDYQRRQMIDLIDPETTSHLGESRIQVRESGIQELKIGNTKELLETDAIGLMEDLVIRTQNRIMANNAWRSLYEMALKDPDSPIARVKKPDIWTLGKEKIITKGAPVKGWSKVHGFINGEKTALYMPAEYAHEWVTKNREVSYEFGKFARLVSGSSIVRSLATGVNVGFAVKNFFRDFAYMWVASQHYVQGQGWTSTYSTFAPKAMFQMAMDLKDVYKDVFMRRGIYKEFVENGGLLDFLSNKDRIMKGRVGKQNNKYVDATIDALYYASTTSELLGRVSLYNRARKKGLSKEEATYIARDYLFFGDYGTYTKAIDTWIPYFGASLKATEGLFRAYSRNSKELGLKAAQAMGLGATMYLLNSSINDKAYHQLSPEDRDRNLIIPIYMPYKGTDGNQHHLVFKIPKDQGQAFFMCLGENAMKFMMGRETDTKVITTALRALSPVQGLPIPPSLEALISYATNTDMWTYDDVWTGGDTGTGMFDRQDEVVVAGPYKTNPLAVGAGKVTGLSPERLSSAMESIVPRNYITDAFTTLSRTMFDKAPVEIREGNVAEIIGKHSITKGLFASTNYMNEIRESAGEYDAADTAMKVRNNNKASMLVEQIYKDKTVPEKELDDFVESIEDENEQKRIETRIEKEKVLLELPHRNFFKKIDAMAAKPAAQTMFKFMKNMTDAEKESFLDEFDTYDEEGSIGSETFEDEIARLEEAAGM